MLINKIEKSSLDLCENRFPLISWNKVMTSYQNLCIFNFSVKTFDMKRGTQLLFTSLLSTKIVEKIYTIKSCQILSNRHYILLISNTPVANAETAKVL